MTDDFSSYPVSISEARANRAAVGGAEIWTPRDCLISVLRQIDSGEMKATKIAIIVAEEDEDGTTCQYHQCVASTLELLGMYTVAAHETQALKRYP